MLEKSNIPKKLAKNLSQLGIFLHILSVAFGILYFSFSVNSFIFDIFGVILIASWILNVLILLIDDSYLNKSTVIGKKINRLTYYNIVSFIIGVLLILWGVILTAFILDGFLFVIAFLMIIIGFFGIEMINLQLALTTFLNVDNRGVWKFE
jgi:hypothetical protein